MQLAAFMAVLLSLSSSFGDDKFNDGERMFQRVHQLIRDEHYDAHYDDDAFWRAAAAGALANNGNGSKWDTLLTPTELAAMERQFSNELVGFGVEIETDSASGIVSLVGVLPGSAAEREGLIAGDRILSIDGRSLKGMTNLDVAHLSAGKAGTSAKLIVFRNGSVLYRTIRRAAFVPTVVTEVSLPNNIALVHVRTFASGTPSALSSTLKHLAGARGLVLDLRENEGGLFEKMMDCAGMLLPKGTLVGTMQFRGAHREEQRTTTDPILTVPMVVLVDSKTSSSAEILAFAIKKYLAAPIVGKRTLGKWSVQRIEPLTNGWAVKLTVAMVRSPSGEMFDGKGVTPDVEVDLDPNETERIQRIMTPQPRVAADPQLRSALAVMRRQ